MTLMLELSPEAEELLQQRASVKGVPASQIATGLLEDDLICGRDLDTKYNSNPPPESDALVRAREFYNRELRVKLEAEYLNQWVAIHPDTGDYLVEPRMGKAFRAMKARHADGSVIVRNIGVADEGLRARLRGERP